ncbi:MAG: WecB/TagA/CpsF family glycosyltransferase [Hyphomicrobiaceae bacterium]
MQHKSATKLVLNDDDETAGRAVRSAGNGALAHVDGWKVNIGTEAEAVAAVVGAARRGEYASLFTLNLDHLVKLRTDRAFANAYARARFVTADGAPVVHLARSQSAAITRTTGADLVLPLADAAARCNLPVYLFGSSNAVLGEAGRRLAANTDGALSIAGSEAPPMGFDPAGAEADKALHRIAASGARICFVALGAPKQEIFAARAADLGIPVVFVCIGAALDFIAGAQVRAPGFMQRHGLEWLWRLATNPRRLATRYAHCAVLYAELALLPRRAAPAATND